jgi:hypothetical protein
MRSFSEKTLLLITALAIVDSTSGPSTAQVMGSENASAKKKHTAYVQTNLVSDGTLTAKTVDPNLKNPWGLTFFPGLSPFWVVDNNGFVSTLYDAMGKPANLMRCQAIPRLAGSWRPCTNAAGIADDNKGRLFRSLIRGTSAGLTAGTGLIGMQG